MNNYKYFTISIIISIVAVIFFFTYYVLTSKMNYTNREYPMWIDVRDNSNKKLDFDFITIGDSRAKVGFKPSVFNFKNINSINLSVGGGTPIEGYYTLKKYLKNNKPKYLLLSYGPFHLSGQDCYWSRTVKFDFLSINEYREVSTIALRLNELKMLNSRNGLKKYKYLPYFNYLYNPSTYIPEFKGSLFNTKKNRQDSNLKILKELKESQGHYYFGRRNFSNGLNYEAKQKGNFIPSKLLNYYMEKTILLAKQNNIQVYYYTMPFNKTSYKKTNLKYKQTYNIYITSLSNKFDIYILNELDYLENSNFGDSSHLFNGVEKATKDIKKRFHSKLK
jgi:hypothetical protein